MEWSGSTHKGEPRSRIREVFKLILIGIFLFELNIASAEETIRIAVGDWPPFLTEDLKHNGVVAHIIGDILASEGYKAEFHFFPWARAYEWGKTGEYDGTAVWLKKPEREQDFYYSDPVLL